MTKGLLHMPVFEFRKDTFCDDLLLYGWSRPELSFVWSEGHHSAINLPYAPAGLCQLRIRFGVYIPDSRRCQFFIIVNGVAQQFVDTNRPDNEVVVSLDGNKLPRSLGINIIFLHVRPARPVWFDGQIDNRLLNVALRTIEIIAAAELRPLHDHDLPTLGIFSVFDKQTLREKFEREIQWMNKINNDTAGNALQRAISFYVRGLGGNHYHRGATRRKILTLAGTQTVEAAAAEHCPAVVGDFLGPANLDGVEENSILPECESSYYDPKFSDPWKRYIATYFSLKRHEAEIIYSCKAVDFVVTDRQYMIVDPAGSCAFPGGNPASLTRMSISPDVVTWNGPVVLLQDEYYCGNVAHFLFDSVVRCVHWLKTYPHLAPDALFIFGGAPTGLHHLVLSVLCAIFDFPASHLIFPTDAMRIRPLRAGYWFASQVRSQHPANGMRPESRDVLQMIARHVLTAAGGERDGFRKIIISRSDASLRRLANENDLAARLEPLGFQRVVMSQLSWEDQIRTVASADVVVAPHGMGLTALAFNQRRPRVVEIFNPTLGTEAYALMCRAYGMDYHRVIGREVDPKKRHFEADIDDIMRLVLERPAVF